MTKKTQEKEFLEHFNNHRKNVKKAYEWLKENTPEIFKDVDKVKLEKAIKNHDESKLDDEEYWPRIEYYYGDGDNEDEYKYTRTRHQNESEHHWQYWVMLKDNAKTPEPVEMTKEAVIEMISDWWSFSWDEGKLDSIFDWYKKQKHIILHPETKKFVNEILDKIERKIIKDTFGV